MRTIFQITVSFALLCSTAFATEVPRYLRFVGEGAWVVELDFRPSGLLVEYTMTHPRVNLPELKSAYPLFEARLGSWKKDKNGKLWITMPEQYPKELQITFSNGTYYMRESGGKPVETLLFYEKLDELKKGLLPDPHKMIHEKWGDRTSASSQ